MSPMAKPVPYSIVSGSPKREIIRNLRALFTDIEPSSPSGLRDCQSNTELSCEAPLCSASSASTLCSAAPPLTEHMGVCCLYTVEPEVHNKCPMIGGDWGRPGTSYCNPARRPALIDSSSWQPRGKRRTKDRPSPTVREVWAEIDLPRKGI